MKANGRRNGALGAKARIESERSAFGGVASAGTPAAAALERNGRAETINNALDFRCERRALGAQTLTNIQSLPEIVASTMHRRSNSLASDELCSVATWIAPTADRRVY